MARHKKPLSEIASFVEQLRPALAYLETIACPECGSRRLTVQIVAASAIRVECHGIAVPGDDDGNCLYSYLVRGDRPITPAPALIALSFEGHEHELS